GYEIRIFSALLGTGQMTAAETSRVSGVPYSKIYEALAGLEEKGWIGSKDSRPTMYYPKSPATGLETTRQRLESEFERDRGVILSELGPMYEKSGTSEKPDIWVLSGTLNIAAKILEMVDSCRREVLIALPEAGDELVERALPKLRSLHDRGVRITVLTSDRTDPAHVAAIGRVASVRIQNGMYGGGIIADKKHVVLLLDPGDGGDVVAVWAEHAGLAGFARRYFEYLLKDSGEAAP
ncbi:MAG: TrmB family transcriptional regulator, partial [Nitrosopumilus sp.]|nr:TrmB family transcriptional regulator [Nitrosopumilus sp.]